MSAHKTVSATWEGDLSFDGVSGSGHKLRMDGRRNVTGFSPMELMIMGLAGCTGIVDLSASLPKHSAPSSIMVAQLEEEIAR